VPKKFEQINNNLFIETSQINKIGMNKMGVNDSEMSMR